MNKDGVFKIDKGELGKLAPRVTQFSAAAKEAILDELGPALTEEWKYNAQKTLLTSRERYIAAIQKPKREKDSVLLKLRPGFATMIENGIDSFNMRETLLTGPKAKTGKDGKLYLRVPFRIKTLSSKAGQGSEFGTPAGVPYRKAFSDQITKKIGSRVMEALKALPSDVVGEGSNRRNADKSELPEDIAPKWKRYSGGVVKSIYAGARREVKRSLDNRTNKRDVFKFTSYRTVSENSDSGWVHPGVIGKNLLPQTLERTDEIVRDIMKGLSGQVFGKK